MKKIACLLLAATLCGCAARAARVQQANEAAAAAQADMNQDLAGIVGCVNDYAIKNYRTAEPDDIAAAVITACEAPRAQYLSDAGKMFRAKAVARYHKDENNPTVINVASMATQQTAANIDNQMRSRTLAKVLDLRASMK